MGCLHACLARAGLLPTPSSRGRYAHFKQALSGLFTLKAPCRRTPQDQPKLPSEPPAPLLEGDRGRGLHLGSGASKGETAPPSSLGPRRPPPTGGAAGARGSHGPGELQVPVYGAQGGGAASPLRLEGRALRTRPRPALRPASGHVTHTPGPRPSPAGGARRRKAESRRTRAARGSGDPEARRRPLRARPGAQASIRTRRPPPADRGLRGPWRSLASPRLLARQRRTGMKAGRTMAAGSAGCHFRRVGAGPGQHGGQASVRWPRRGPGCGRQATVAPGTLSRGSSPACSRLPAAAIAGPPEAPGADGCRSPTAGPAPQVVARGSAPGRRGRWAPGMAAAVLPWSLWGGQCDAHAVGRLADLTAPPVPSPPPRRRPREEERPPRPTWFPRSTRLGGRFSRRSSQCLWSHPSA